MTVKRTLVAVIVVCCIAMAGCGHHRYGSTYVPPTNSGTTPSSSGGSSTAGVGTAIACPPGSVTVTTSTVPTPAANTNYCFASGTYSNFGVTPQSGDGFYGGEHAVLDGGSSKTSAFASSGTLTYLTIDGFTMQNYYSSSNDHAPGVIEFQFGNHITISNNTIQNDRTSAVSFGDNTGAPCCSDYTAGVNSSLITHNVISNIGYAGTPVAGGSNDTISYNDISGTDQDNVNTEGDIAATGKFSIDDGTVVNGNYIHSNNDTAIWFDNYDVNTTIENNTVTSNRVGIFYEISWNALITGNTLTSNGQPDAGDGLSAPGAAIRISSSGNCSNQPTNGTCDGPNSITVSNNTLTYNHEGITLWAGHTNTNGTPIYTNNVNVTGNTTVGDNTSTATDSDAWMAHDGTIGYNLTWSNNTYKAGSSSESTGYYFSLNTGTTNWSGWQSNSLDTSGSSCQNSSGGSC